MNVFSLLNYRFVLLLYFQTEIYKNINALKSRLHFIFTNLLYRSALVRKKTTLSDDKHADSEFLHLNKAFKTEKKPEPHGNENVSSYAIILHIFWLSLYIISCYTARSTTNAYSMVTSIRDLFQNRPMDYNGKTYNNIVTKNDIDSFISDVLIDQLYEESLKEYPAMVEGYHYVKFYNYFAGMRLT